MCHIIIYTCMHTRQTCRCTRTCVHMQAFSIGRGKFKPKVHWVHLIVNFFTLSWAKFQTWAESGKIILDFFSIAKTYFFETVNAFLRNLFKTFDTRLPTDYKTKHPKLFSACWWKVCPIINTVNGRSMLLWSFLGPATIMQSLICIWLTDWRTYHLADLLYDCCVVEERKV